MNILHLFFFSCTIIAANGGHADVKIVGGKPVTIDEYPYQVSVQYFGSHICGGSILSPRAVLTAARCTNGFTSLTVRAGTSFRGNGGQVVQVTAVREHPGYNDNTNVNDVSVLILANPLTVGSAIELATEVPPAGSNVVVTGWGDLGQDGTLSTQLQAVTVQTFSQEYCRNQYKGYLISDDMICAGLTSGGKDACQGDSGGPLVADGRLIGVVSWGIGCADPRYPGVYANVVYNRNHILSSIEW